MCDNSNHIGNEPVTPKPSRWQAHHTIFIISLRNARTARVRARLEIMCVMSINIIFWSLLLDYSQVSLLPALTHFLGELLFFFMSMWAHVFYPFLMCNKLHFGWKHKKTTTENIVSFAQLQLSENSEFHSWIKSNELSWVVCARMSHRNEKKSKALCSARHRKRGDKTHQWGEIQISLYTETSSFLPMQLSSVEVLYMMNAHTSPESWAKLIEYFVSF